MDCYYTTIVLRFNLVYNRTQMSNLTYDTIHSIWSCVADRQLWNCHSCPSGQECNSRQPLDMWRDRQASVFSYSYSKRLYMLQGSNWFKIGSVTKIYSHLYICVLWYDPLWVRSSVFSQPHMPQILWTHSWPLVFTMMTLPKAYDYKWCMDLTSNV